MSETHLIEQAPSHEGEDNDLEMDEGMYTKTKNLNERATDSLLAAGKAEKKPPAKKRRDSKQVPSEIVTYIQDNKINQVVKSALNQVLKEMPADPLSALAGQLFEKANKSYPVFDNIKARRVFLHDLATVTLELKVFLTYQGRTELRHTHIMTFDETQLADFIWDKPEEKTGLQKVCNLVNEDVNLKMKGLVLQNQVYADNKLGELIKEVEAGEEEKGRKIIIRACSEAVMYAVAKCFEPNQVYRGFLHSYYPRDEEFGVKNTQLLMTVLNGGKAMGSAVKFSKFYLVVDAGIYSEPMEIITYYQKFLVAFKKGIQATKAGEAGFKLGVDGSYLNANATIAESFKMMEDAIAASGANTDDRKLFKIGINCDADNSYNKDPKDPKKYEQEGQKTQFDTEMMIEYYCKMLQDHPLISYVEDAFAQFDFEAHKLFRDKLQNEFKNVDMSLKQVFMRGGIKRMKAVTEFKEFDPSKLEEKKETVGTPDASIEADKSKTSKKGTPTPPEKGKKTPAAGGATEDPLSQEFPEADPENPNKHKVTPDCACLEMSQILNMTQLKEHFVHASNLDEELQFGVIIQDTQYDTYLSNEVVDLAFGLNAQYLVIRGCTKNEKISKLQRFCEIKEEQRNEEPL